MSAVGPGPADPPSVLCTCTVSATGRSRERERVEKVVTSERLSCCRTDYFYRRFVHPGGHLHCWLTVKSCRTLPPPHVWSAFRSGENTLKKRGRRNVTSAIFGENIPYQQQTRNMDYICDACVTCTDHGVTQYVGGLAQFVLGDSAVKQDGLQQAGVVQVNVIVPLLRTQNTRKHTFNPLSCNYSQKQEHYCTMSVSVNNDCCVRLPSHSV